MCIRDRICPIQTVKPDEAESRTAEEFAPQLQLKQLGFVLSLIHISYLVELEYEDHTEVGSALEHDILPNQDFTVRRFSHH